MMGEKCDKCGLLLSRHHIGLCPVSMDNYMVQARRAEQDAAAEWARLRRAGYKENALGELVSPDGKVTVGW
jgi:uncharacterized Zn finger protein (UPF0148 family)